MLARVLPFALYLFFLALAQTIGWLAGQVPALARWDTAINLWLYPVKTAVVAGALLFFWPTYHELKTSPFNHVRDLLLAVAVGVGIYFLWINATWSWATQGQSSGYNPFLGGERAGILLAAIRLLGAAIIVPVMEELFWRSFVVRYLISSRFEAVPLGTFTWFSFLATVVLFGLEHNLWFAGMVAGVAYTLLVYQTRKLWPSIMAHSVTNLALGIHVLLTGDWSWW